MVILADDLGNADLGYRGSDIKTPNIDRLASDGVRAESFYGMPVCTPARAALMTGRYAMRYGLQTLVIFPSHVYGLPTDERTLPQALKEAGYQTAMVGKWHLGHADKKFWPQNRGFDHFYGNLVGEVDYFTKDRGGLIDWQRDGKFLKEDGYFTTLIGNEAVNIIQSHNTSKPLFLYVASLASHAPYQAPKQDIDAYKNAAGDVHRHTYAAMITDLDTQVGRIVAALKPHEDVLINVEAFRGAIRKGNWKLVKIALLPGKTELFDLEKDPGEKNNVASQFPEVVNDLEARLIAYAKEMKPSQWIKVQLTFLGAQGKTIFDPDFDIDDSGLPHEKPVLPK